MQLQQNNTWLWNRVGNSVHTSHKGTSSTLALWTWILNTIFNHFNRSRWKLAPVNCSRYGCGLLLPASKPKFQSIERTKLNVYLKRKKKSLALIFCWQCWLLSWQHTSTTKCATIIWKPSSVMQWLRSGLSRKRVSFCILQWRPT